MRSSVPAGDYERAFRPARRGRVVEASHHLAIERAGIEAGHTVLDLGCGTGPLLALLAERGATAVGLDYSGAALAVARDAQPTVRLVRGAAPALPFRDAVFDRVAALGVLGYLGEADLRRALAECARVLRTGGVLLVCTGRRLNAVAGWLQRVRGWLRRDPVRTGSHLYSRATYGRAMAAAGLVAEDWVSWPAAPRAWWARCARPFYAARWFAATKRGRP